MKKYYKLTDENMATHGGCLWQIGEKKTTDGSGDLCGPGWLHCYDSPLLAVLLNPIGSDFKSPRLFEISVGGKKKTDYGLKFGFTEMTLIKEITLPTITRTQKIAFGILCAKEIYKDEKWNLWADNWLSGKDRSTTAAGAAEAAWAAEAWAAAWAAAAAAGAAEAAEAWAAAWAAAAAAEAFCAGAGAIDLKKIAKNAMTY